MKKSIRIILICLMSLIGNIANAHDFEAVNEGETIYYVITSSADKTVAVSYRGSSASSYSNEYSGSISIPESVTYNSVEYSVTSIGNYAFGDCSGLTSINIPNSVTSIGERAFDGCSGLTSITIPNSVTSIGKEPFYNCSNVKELIYAEGTSTVLRTYLTSITSVTIPNSVTSIGDYAFYDCSGLTSITIPNSVTSIGDGAFKYCSRLTSITIPNSVTSIGYYAFSYCSGLTSITIPNSVTSIGYYAFKYCSGLTSITIPNSVTSIGDYAFSDCSGLTSITIPNSVTSIGSYAFSDCSGLTSVTIPNSVTGIAYYAFNNCSNVKELIYAEGTSTVRYTGLTSIESVTIPNSVTSIGDYAFSDCSGLTSITIPNSVTSIGYYAFKYCSGLTSITIPNSVTSIEYRAFSGCSQIKEVNIEIANLSSNNIIPDYIDCTIYNYFYKGKMLEGNFTIPDNISTIGKNTFYKCSGLTSITIPNSVTSIGEQAFLNTNLKSLVIGTGVTSIGYNACTNVKKTIWMTNTPPSGYSNIQSEVNYVANNQYSFSNQIVYPYLSSMFEVGGARYVPVSPSERTCDLIDCVYGEDAANINIANTVTYKNINLTTKEIRDFAFYGNHFIKDVKIDFEGKIGNSAFYGCEGVDSVRIMHSGDIGNYAFNNCNHVNLVSISNIGNIGQNAFSGCTNLQTASLSNTGVIGDNAFNRCDSLKSITIKDGVAGIGKECFSNLIKLNKLSITNSTLSIGERAFAGCSSLSDVELGEGITSLSKGSFSGCSSISLLTVPGSVTEVCDSTFKNCIALEKINLTNGIGSLGNYSFYGCTNLKQLQIPQSITTIGNYAFSGCTSLSDFVVDNHENTLSLGSNGSSPLFSSCPLDSVYLGGKLSYNTGSSYGYSPFYRNTSLRSVTINNQETQLYDNEFYGCTGLKNVKVGDGITTIGKWAFSGCANLDNFSFGSSVASIGLEAFSDCVNMTQISTSAATPPTCGSQALDDINKWNCVLTVPAESIDEYMAADQWKEFFFIEGGNMLAESISLDCSATGLLVGNQLTLNATILPTGTLNKFVEWSSSDNSVATVNNGVVTGLTSGTVIITAKTTDGTNLSATCVINVSYINNVLAFDKNLNDVSFYAESGDNINISDTYYRLGVGTDIANLNVSYSRTFKNTNWQPLYVPFDMDVTSELLEDFSFAKYAGTYTEDDGTFCITIAKLNEGGKIKSNTPYFIKAKVADSSNPQTISVAGTTLHATAENSIYLQSAEKKVEIFGIYNKKTFTAEEVADGNVYGYGGGTYNPQTAGQTLGAFRFFIKVTNREDNPYDTDTPSSIKLKVLGEDDDATGIDALSTDTDSDNNIYDISGRAVSKPGKGVYIKNGKKYYVK